VVEVIEVVFRVGRKEFRQVFFDADKDEVDYFIDRILPNDLIRVIRRKYGH